MNLEGKIPGVYYEKAEKWLEEQRETVVKPFIEAHKSHVVAIAEALLEKEELSSDEIAAILESVS
jgi:ATP-dependent Zn protease